MKKRKVISVLLAATMVVGMVSGCGGSKEPAGTDGKEEAKGKVYYLNFKPEADEQWQELAEALSLIHI